MPKVTNHTVGGDRGTSKPALGESWKSVPHVRLQLSRDAGSNVCQASILKHSFMVYSFMHMHHWAHLQSVLFTFYLTQEAACPRFLTSLSKKRKFYLVGMHWIYYLTFRMTKHGASLLSWVGVQGNASWWRQFPQNLNCIQFICNLRFWAFGLEGCLISLAPHIYIFWYSPQIIKLFSPSTPRHS